MTATCCKSNSTFLIFALSLNMRDLFYNISNIIEPRLFDMRHITQIMSALLSSFRLHKL